MNIHEENRSFRSLFGFNIPLDMIMTMIRKKGCIDIMKLDKEIARRNSDYDPDECTYKGKSGYSLEMVIKEIYGQKAIDFIKKLI